MFDKARNVIYRTKIKQAVDGQLVRMTSSPIGLCDSSLMKRIMKRQLAVDTQGGEEPNRVSDP